MNCNLLDLKCHAKSFAIDWWMGLPLLVQLAIIVGIGFMAWGMIERVIAGVRWVGQIIHRFGGWQGVVGASVAALAIAVSVVIALWPKKGDDFTGEVDGVDAKGPFRFGVERKKRAKKRKPVAGPSEPWLRQPGETAQDWYERTTTSK